MLGIRTRAKRMVGAGEKCLSDVPWVNVAKQSFKKWFQWFLVQVAERSLQTPEISCSNPVIGNFYFLSTVIKRQKLRRTHGPFKNCKFSTEGSTAYTPQLLPSSSHEDMCAFLYLPDGELPFTTNQDQHQQHYHETLPPLNKNRLLIKTVPR